MPVKVKAIIPKALKTKAMREPYIDAMEQTILIAQDMFEGTTRTFDETDVKFKKKVKDSPTKIVGTVDTDNEIYGYLNNGTKVRYATMTSDFESKTEPGFLGSKQGRGGLLYVDRRRPRPGIEGRHFDKMVAKEIKPILETKAEQASAVAANKSGHAI